MKKHLAIVTRCMHGGGAERVIAQLSNYLVANAWACSIIMIENTPVQYALDPQVSVYPIGQKSNNKIIDRILRYGQVRRIVQERKADIVLSMPEEIGIYAVLAMIGSGIPVIVSERNNPWVMPDVKITRMLRTLAYPFAKGLIFQTEMAKSFFPRSIQKKGIVLPNPVDASRIPLQYQTERRKVIVGAGRLHPQKNFPLLINAFAQFYKIHPAYQLVIWGEGPQRPELEKQIRDLDLESAILLPGRNNQLLEEIKDCAMFVLSSDYEGSPNALIEAMCMGMPVISTDCPSGGPRELIQDGENGMLIPVGDAVSLYTAMETFASDRELCSRMSDMAYRMRQQFTSKEIFHQWGNFLLKIASDE